MRCQAWHKFAYCFICLLSLDPPTFIVELGSNVSPLAQVCSKFGAPYIGIEPDERLRFAMLREFFGWACKMISIGDRNFAEWAHGIFLGVLCVFFSKLTL